MRDIPVLTEERFSRLARSLQKAARAKHRKTGLPLVTLKFAQTLDGKLATITGDSKWISSPSSLRLAHRLRSTHDAVLVGADTIIRDDPRLTVRLVKGKSPRRVIADSRLRIPLGSKVLGRRSAPSTLIATTSLSDQPKIDRIISTGAQVWRVRKDPSDRVDLRCLLQKLGKADIRSVLVEGGARILTSSLKRRLADYLVVVMAPKIVGKGIDSVEPAASRGPASLIAAPSLRYFRSDDDIVLFARIDEH
jgi:riboflavin-specific deaminase-like protein